VMENTPEIDMETFSVDKLRREDIPTLRPIVKTWMRHLLRVSGGRVKGTVVPEDVEAVITNLRDSLLDDSGMIYHVLRNETGKAVGMAGLIPLDDVMTTFSTTSNPILLEHMFLAHNYRGKGLGRRFMFAVLEKARILGFTEVIWNSGPRFKRTAWGFYTKLFGEPIGVARKYFQGKWDARVWSVVFE
jgi:GNAT superfamily N-acetyltransferase